MKNRSFLIKPASGNCNMHCDYCFYVDEMKERTMKNYGMMSLETSHKLIDRAFEDMDSGLISFMFQGGEPSTRGLGFFRDFVSYVAEKRKGTIIDVQYAFQTNGYIIDDEWAEFFHDNNFLLGVSMDGNGKIHDTYRHIQNGKGSFKYTFRTANLFKKHGVEFNILSTVNSLVAANAEEVYNFFKKNGFRHIQFIPCIDFIDGDRGTLPWSITGADYGVFLKKIFRLYFNDWRDGNYISVRYFDNLVMMLLGAQPEACGQAGVCGNYYTVEADGSVFPCDFYVLDDYRMGNIVTDTLPELDKKRKEIGFVEKSRKVDEACKTCKYFMLCRGGCRRDRENFQTGELDRTYLCDAYKDFFDYAIRGLEIMAQEEMRARAMAGRH